MAKTMFQNILEMDLYGDDLVRFIRDGMMNKEDDPRALLEVCNRLADYADECDDKRREVELELEDTRASHQDIEFDIESVKDENKELRSEIAQTNQYIEGMREAISLLKN